MKIAITGSSGLIGSQLSAYLTDQGHQVIKLVRQSQQALGPEQSWWEPTKGLLQPEKLEGLDACVHLAGYGIADSRWTARRKMLIRQSRVEATQILCRDLLKLAAPPRSFISASAIGIYGDCGDELVNEDHLPGSTDEFLVRTALDWEQASTPLSAAGIAVFHARFGVVLASQGGALAKMLPLFRWGLGSQLGHGRQYFSWIALADVVRALEWLLNRQPTSPTVAAYNVVAPNPVTNAEFTVQLCQRLQRRPFFPIPALALRMLLGEMAEAALLASCRAIPERLLTQGFAFKHSTLDSALRAVVSRQR